MFSRVTHCWMHEDRKIEEATIQLPLWLCWFIFNQISVYVTYHREMAILLVLVGFVTVVALSLGLGVPPKRTQWTKRGCTPHVLSGYLYLVLQIWRFYAICVCACMHCACVCISVCVFYFFKPRVLIEASPVNRQLHISAHEILETNVAKPNHGKKMQVRFCW